MQKAPQGQSPDIVTAEVNFARQLNGYDRDQVDRYITRLADAYQIAYVEYSGMVTEFNDLQQRCQQLQEEEQNRPNPEVITKILMDSEIMAQKRLADVEAEAGLLLERAHAQIEEMRHAIELERDAFLEFCAEEKAKATQQAQKTIEAAQQEATSLVAIAQQTLDEAQEEAKQIKDAAQFVLDDAEAQMGKARVRAQRIIQEATAAATQIEAAASQNQDQICAMIGRAIDDLQEMLQGYSSAAVIELKKPAPVALAYDASRIGN